jgi:hypothetical protein
VDSGTPDLFSHLDSDVFEGESNMVD